MKEELLSIIIPTYNEEENIASCLNSLLEQSHQNFEILVVDDGSKDKTKAIVSEIIKENKQIKLLKGEHKGPGTSRNLGAKKSKGKILIFVDADMTFDKDYLKFLIKPILEEKSIGTEDGFQLASNLKNVWSRCWGKYANTRLENIKKYDKKGAPDGYIFRAILREEFEKMGGFDPKYGYADDMTFYFKFNKKSLRIKEAFCYHKNPETLRAVYAQSKWIGASIRNNLLQNKFSPFLLVFLSLFAIPILSVKKCYSNKDFSLLFPWMFLFITVRYFGTIRGIVNRNYFNRNYR